MADRIELQLGHVPWRPTPDVELVATYRYYDGPLTGVIRQHGNEYLFSCLDGEADMLSLWWYAAISAEQRARLEALSQADFANALNNENLTGWAVLAFATERLGIVDFEPVEDSADPEMLRTRMLQALDELRRRLQDLSQDAGQLELTLA